MRPYASFRRELLRQPRYLSAMAVHEAMGNSSLEFLWQIKAVSVVEETPGFHWLVLPACHRGCETRDASLTPPPGGSCAVCGRPTVPRTDADRIHAVDDFTARTVAADEWRVLVCWPIRTGFLRRRVWPCSESHPSRRSASSRCGPWSTRRPLFTLCSWRNMSLVTLNGDAVGAPPAASPPDKRQQQRAD